MSPARAGAAAKAPAGGSRALVRLRCRDSLEAARLRRALQVDDPEGVHCTVSVEGTLLTVEASGSTALGMLRTLDDLLGCVRAAEPDL